MGRRPVWIWWTSGKDAAWTLHVLRAAAGWDVKGLVAAVTTGDGRSWLHGVKRELLEDQADAAGLPLKVLEVEPRADPPMYDAAVHQVCADIRSGAPGFVAFGDLFSARRRRRRTELLQGTGLEAVFPLWGRPSPAHAREMLASGLMARVCSLAPTDLPAGRAGMRFDEAFLEALPPHIDPCGEHDEFHTFVEWSPGWRRRVSASPGRRIDRYGLAIRDLVADAGLPEPETPPFHAGGIGGRPDPLDYFERLKRLRTHVAANLSADLAIARVAPVAGLAPSSFRRYFRKRMGTTYGVWLARLRIENAARMLRESGVEVSDVGRAVGYPVDRSFRRAFRRHAGCSPSRYREMYLAGRLPELPE